MAGGGRAEAQLQWEPLNVGYYELPPYLEIIDGKLTGVLFDIWDDIASKVGVRYVPVNLPPARLVKSLAEGDVDVSMIPINFPELAGHVLVSKEPAEHIVLEAYNFGPAPLITSIRDLVGKSVIVQQGFGYGGLITYLRAPENRITIVASAPHAESGIRMLQAGRADVLLHYRPAIKQLRRTMNLVGLQSTVLSAVPIHVVLSKSVPNSAALMARFDAAINASELVR